MTASAPSTEQIWLNLFFLAVVGGAAVLSQEMFIVKLPGD
jgi:hypothetical protein